MKVAEGPSTSQRVCVSHKWSMQVEEGLCGRGKSKKVGKNKGRRHVGGKGIGIANSKREIRIRKTRNYKEKERHINKW